jgi:hypothetical protein
VKIARGPDGFRVTLEPTVQAHLEQVLQDHPEFAWRWEAVIARLRATGHVTGDDCGANGTQRAGAFLLDKWRVKLAWRVLGDGLRIVRAEF